MSDGKFEQTAGVGVVCAMAGNRGTTRQEVKVTAATEMIRSYPADLGAVDRDALIHCIEECVSCAQACTACADAYLSESDDQLPILRTCIRSAENCADLCNATARMLSRHTGYDADVTRTVLQACIIVCRSCGDECASHASQHEHCRACAEACRSCEQTCQALIEALG